jgi:hypothetical protein
MSESPRSNNSKVNATDVDINSTKTTGVALDLKANSVDEGVGLKVSATSLTTGSAVEITGVATKTALNVVTGNTTLGGVLSNRQLDFLTGNCKNFAGTLVAISDSEAEAGVGGNAAAKIAAQMNADALNTCAFDADAAGEIYLPAATANTHLAVHIIAAISGGTNALTITATEALDDTFAATTGVFAFQQIGPLHGGGVAGHSVITGGSAGSPVSVKLIYTPAAATTNYLGVGSVIHFYCQTAGEWMVRIFNVPEGTGATGALTVS